MVCLSARNAQIAGALVVLFAAGAIAGFAKVIWVMPLANGVMATVTIWSALASTQWYVRWPCGGAIFWLAMVPLRSTDWRLDLWKLYLSWDTLPHALLTFMILCVLRELGMRIEGGGAPRDQAWTRRFNLRRLFAWIAGAAIATLFWKELLLAIEGVSWPGTFGIGTFGMREVLIEGVSRSVAWTVIDLLALWAVLRSGRLRWRQMWWLAAVLIVQTVVWRYADFAVLGRTQSWERDVSYACGEDVFYIAPLLGSLLLARAAGYRLAWSRRAESRPLLPAA